MTKLERITLNNVKSITGSAFRGCRGLNEIIATNSNSFRVIDGALYQISASNRLTLIKVPSARSYKDRSLEIDPSTTAINEYALENLYQLNYLKLPHSINILENTIVGNNSLWIDFNESRVPSGINTANNKINIIDNTKLYKFIGDLVYLVDVENGSNEATLIYVNSLAVGNIEIASSIIINDISYDVKKISDNVFNGIKGINSIYVPASVDVYYNSFRWLQNERVKLLFEASSIDIWNSEAGYHIEYNYNIN